MRFGGLIKKTIIRGSGKRTDETSLHINHLELEAVYKSIVYFLPHLKNQKPVSITKGKHLLSRSKDFQSNGITSINKDLENKGFSKETRNFYQHHGEKEQRLPTIVNSESSVVGVINGIKIPIQYL